MAKFSQNNPPIRVLMLDVKAAGFTLSNFPWSAHDAFFKSIGAHVEWRHAPSMNAGDQVYSDHWDLIVIPWIGDITSQYSFLKVQLALFVDTGIPIWYAQCYLAAGVNAQPTTGITVVNAAGKFTSTGLINWEDRMGGQVTFYGDAPTIAGASTVTTHATDLDNDAVMLWSNPVEGHPALFMTAYSSQTSTLAKPWLGAQWMVDQCPTAARKAQLLGHLRKRHLSIRFDMGGLNNDEVSRANGDLDTAYDSLNSYGVKGISLAFLWGAGGSFGTLPDTANSAVANWFLVRDRSNGGLFRCMNHETDIVDGTTFTPNERCTTDSINPDGFKNAANAYETHCDQLTAFGFQLGDNGYGGGDPNVQNGNDMNNPSAHFLSGSDGIYDTDGFYGGYDVAGLWVSGDEDYPTGLTPQASIRHSITWAKGTTLLGYSEDTMTSSNLTNMAVTWNADINRCLINGGGIYYHGGVTNFTLPDHVTELGQLRTSCPDIIEIGDWPAMLADLKHGISVWFDG